MTPRSWRRAVAGAVVLPVAGLGLAGLLLVAAPDRDLSTSVIVFAMAALPLAALVGGLVGRWWPEGSGEGGPVARPRAAGAVAAVLGGLGGAQLAAMIRFYQAGARGFLSLAAAPYTSEVLMVIAVLPSLAAIGAVVAGRRWPRGVAVALMLALVLGAVAAPAVGLSLIAVRAASAVLNPFLLWTLVVAVIAIGGRLTKR